jgi:hypothetical protein
MLRHRGGPFFITILAIASFARIARPDSEVAYALRWNVAEGAQSCGETSTIERAVRERLWRPRSLVPAAKANVTIDVRVARILEPRGWQAFLTLRDPTGTVLGIRRLKSEAESCTVLRDSLALAVALMIDASGAKSAAGAWDSERGAGARQDVEQPTPPASVAAIDVPERAPAFRDQRETASAADRSAPSASDASHDASVGSRDFNEAPEPADMRGTDRQGEPWNAQVGTGIRISSGLLPSVPLGAVLWASLAPTRSWGLEGYVAAWTPETSPAPRGALGQFTLAIGGASGCATLFGRPRETSLAVCAGVEAGALHVTGRGFDAIEDSTVPTLDVVSRSLLMLPLGGPFLARLGGLLGVPLLRQQFSYVDASGASQALYRRPVAAGSAEVSLAVQLR